MRVSVEIWELRKRERERERNREGERETEKEISRAELRTVLWQKRSLAELGISMWQKRPIRLKMENGIDWHFKCNRLYVTQSGKRVAKEMCRWGNSAEYLFCHHSSSQNAISVATESYLQPTGWWRPIGWLELRVSFEGLIFRIRATEYRALWRKMTCQDKESYRSLPPCMTVATKSYVQPISVNAGRVTYGLLHLECHSLLFSILNLMGLFCHIEAPNSARDFLCHRELRTASCIWRVSQSHSLRLEKWHSKCNTL